MLGEILNAFITIFRAQTRSLSNDPAIHKARDLKQALHIIYQYGLVNPNVVQDGYSAVELPADIINNASGQTDYNFSDQQYDAIQQAILHQYGYEYDLNRLAFWLITLHTPFNHSLTEFEFAKRYLKTSDDHCTEAGSLHAACFFYRFLSFQRIR